MDEFFGTIRVKLSVTKKRKKESKGFKSKMIIITGY